MKVNLNEYLTLKTRQELSEEYINELKQAFDIFDVTGRGLIYQEDMDTIFKALGLDLIGENREKEQDFNEFIDEIVKILTKKDSDEELLKTFNLIDSNNKGQITYLELKNVVKQVYEDVSDEEIKDMMYVAKKYKVSQDELETEKILPEDFIQVLTKL